MATEDSFYQFCGESSFWNESFFENSSWPRMTPCFVNSAIVWIPCAWLWIAFPFHICSLYSKENTGEKLPVNVLNGLKEIICIFLCILSIVCLTEELTKSGLEEERMEPIIVLNECLYLATFLLAGILVQIERIKGCITSYVQFIFWLFLMLTNIIPFYTRIFLKTYSGNLFDFVTFHMFYFFVFVQFILQCWAEKKDPLYTMKDEKEICPEMDGSIMNRSYFWWMNRIVIQSYKRPLEEEDVWSLGIANKSRSLVPKLERNWNKELQKAQKKQYKNTVNKDQTHVYLNGTYSEETPLLSSDHMSASRRSSYDKSDRNSKAHTREKGEYKPSLGWAMFKTFGYDYCMSLLIKTLSDLLQLLSPILLGILINYSDSKTDLPVWRGYVPAILLFLTTIFQSVFYHRSIHIGMTVGMRFRSALIAAIFKKSLTLNPSAKKSTTLGEIVNLMSVDCQRIQDTFSYGWSLVSSPVMLIIGTFILWEALGPSCLAGVFVLLILVPINSVVVVIQTRLQLRILRWKGKRMKMINEILNGIKVLKMYAWEPSFKAQVQEIRNKELQLFKNIAYLQGATSFGWILAPYLMGLATFSLYVTLNENHWLDSYKVFVALSVFNILRMPTTMLTISLSFVSQAYVSIKRIESFLVGRDLDEGNVQHRSNSDYAIEIENGTFTWDLNMPVPTLRDINLTVDEGELIAVVGQVGCGKSSIVSALLGDMDKLDGRVNVKGSLAYVPQEAWIQNATLKDNILFGNSFLQKKYNKVIDACALTQDLEILPGGDMIEIGEKGINISGGQKQRVSLARAVYNNSDVYLMDDPLSAVDSHVGKHIFERVIGPKGLLKNKTRLLVTHGVHWLPMVDTVVVMENGKVSEVGSYEDLVSHNGAFAQFLKQYLTHEDDSDIDDPEIQEIKHKMFERVESVTSDGFTTTDTEGQMSLSKLSNRRRTISQTSEIKKPEKSKQTERLTKDESSQQGEIKLSVFTEYIKSAGICASIFVTLIYALYHCINVFSNYWLTFWTEDEYLKNNQMNSTSGEFIDKSYQYLIVYGALGPIQVACVMIYAIMMSVRLVIAAGKLHNRMLEKILRAPMSFFDTTPIGRITNRFSSDVDIMDNALPLNFRIILGTIYSAITTLIVITINTPVFLAVIIPVAIIYYILLKFYIPTARQLKRIESVTRSPVYNHFSETVTGASVIRAFGATDRFLKESMKRVDKNLVYYYANFSSSRWLGLRLEILGNTLVLAASLFSLLSNLDGGTIGLSITYALQATSILNILVVNISDMANNVVCVERIKEYCEIDKEADWYTDRKPPSNWPTTGNITFTDYKTRYRQGLDLVLKGINLEIKHGEMIGIVGRTGAGKSSLTLSLFRLIEAASGGILIDGVKIDDMGLHDLRSKITILPQDPVLFSGSLRMNLDPFDHYTDDEIWQALESAHLKDFVLTTPTQLDYQCGEGGSNLSVGQRQLVCLARTLLKKTNILILDEATAAVDFQTDDLIQETIRSEFRNCTVLAIAHRLNTILDYDRVMVLDDGHVVEFDTPQNLLEDKNTIFYSMARDAGLTSGMPNKSFEDTSGVDIIAEMSSVQTSTPKHPKNFPYSDEKQELLSQDKKPKK